MIAANLALSTIGMSAYNLVARNGGPMSTATLATVLAAGLRVDVAGEVFDAALMALLSRGYLTLDDLENTVDVVDTQRRLVRWRDRTGSGWNNWTVIDATGPHKLDEVIP